MNKENNGSVKTQETWCPACGFGVKLDENGCCAMCGLYSVGPGVDEAVDLAKRAFAAEEKLIALEQAARQEAWSESPPDGNTDHKVTFERFWAPLVMKADGEIDIDQIKRELHDFWVMLEEVPKVYMHVTGDMISKPNTCASAVIAAHDDRVTEDIEEFEAEIVEKFEGKRRVLVNRLETARTYIKSCRSEVEELRARCEELQRVLYAERAIGRKS